MLLYERRKFVYVLTIIVVSKALSINSVREHKRDLGTVPPDVGALMEASTLSAAV